MVSGVTWNFASVFWFESLISGLVEGLGMSHDIFPCECRLRSEINSFRILKFNGQLINFHCWNFRGHVAIHYIRYSLFLGTLETDLPKGVVNPGWFKYGMKNSTKRAVERMVRQPNAFAESRVCQKQSMGWNNSPRFKIWQHKHHRYYYTAISTSIDLLHCLPKNSPSLKTEKHI